MRSQHLLFRAMVAAHHNHEPVAANDLHQQLGAHSTVGCPLCSAPISSQDVGQREPRSG